MTERLQNLDENPASANGTGPDAVPDEDDAFDGEFRLTVRKLEVPVRPRGVLAD
jgi:hypothetical protein